MYDMNGQVAKNVVFLADSRKLEFLLAPESIDLIITGPPYWNEVVYSEDEGQLSAINDYRTFLKEITTVWAGCKYVLKGGGVMAVWVHDFFRNENGILRYVPFHCDIVKTVPEELVFKNIMIWDRYLNRNRGPIPETESVSTRFEYVLIFQKAGDEKNALAAKSLSEIYWEPIWSKKTHPKVLGLKSLFRILFSISKPFSSLLTPLKNFLNKTPLIRDEHAFRYYSTECPEELIERLIGDFSSRNDTILDPFLGSGTVMRVAQRMGRRCIGIEINKAALSAIEKKVGTEKFEIRR
jgi:DNA modification methylase